ncbi:MAG: tetratricopeptide repeat protein [bacterium]
MIEKDLSLIEKWQVDFDQQPMEVLDRLLIGHTYMGQLNRNDTDEILFRLFHMAAKDRQATLDKAMRNWLERYWEDGPSFISTSRWAEILQNAFSTAIRLNLLETQVWLLKNHTRARAWLRGLYLGPDRDPEADLLRTLSLCQRNQDMLPLWMRLCRMEEDRPLHFASIGLLGLRKLPDENGEPSGDLPLAVFRGIVDLANAIDRQVRQKKEGEAFWFLKVRAMMARYPRSSQYWTENFLLFVSPDSPAAKWLGKLIPILKKVLDSSVTIKRTARSSFRQPSRDEFGTIRELIKRHPLKEVRPKLDVFLGEHKYYALQTGDADILVKVFCEVGYKILRQDPDWALVLVEEAFIWAPYNSIVWVERAKIESYCGRQTRALGLLWEAKRKFPEVPEIRTNLAEMLRKYGKDDIAEIVYRQAVEDFSRDEVCRNGLAEVLKAQGKLDEAEAVYRQAVKDFPRNEVCRNGLAEVLKAQGRLDEAEAVYRQTMKDFPRDEVCRNGLAVIWLLQHKWEDSVRLLEETVKRFPNDPFAKDLLQKVKKKQETPEVLSAEYDKFTTAMAEAKRTPSRDISPSAIASKQVMPAQNKETVYPLKPEAEEEERERTDAVIFDEVSPVPLTSKLPADEEGVVETKIGLANLYRWIALHAEGEKKVRYQQESVTVCEDALAKSPNNTFALLEKGFGMVDQEPQEAETFFDKQIINGKQPHILGFRIGHLQAKTRQGKIVTKEWKELMNEFPSRKTLITLENARQELFHTNETTLSIMEAVRKQVVTDNIDMLPITLQENEKWIRFTVEKRLFTGIDLKDPFTEDILPTVLENHVQNNLILQGIVEQSLVNI